MPTPFKKANMIATPWLRVRRALQVRTEAQNKQQFSPFAKRLFGGI
jgi:hypothetical protein